MPSKLYTTLAIIILVILLAAGLWAVTAYYADLPNQISQHETLVLGQNRFSPGSQAAVRLLVQDSRDASPLPGAEINISLRSPGSRAGVPLFTGVTDEQGNASVTFTVPEGLDPAQTLVVETKSRLGSDTLERPVTIQRDYRVLLTTDKPIYQPGQVIHLRALALSTFDLTPAAGQDLEVSIQDGKGNRVFRKTLLTSDYGVAAADFQLASEVNTGPYKISAVLGGVSSEKTVTVEHYVLPKFELDLETERPFYLPGEHVRGSLKGNYFFGKPVAGGEVRIEGYTFDVELTPVFNLSGMTDEAGNFEFEFDLPSYIAGADLDGGLGRFYLQASLTDLAKHTETSNLSLPVAQSSLVIEAVFEGGQVIPGVENILYVLTSYPDGSPAQTSLTLDFQDGTGTTAETGAYGLAEIRLTPQSAWMSPLITARDAQGNVAEAYFYFDGQAYGDSVLLRPDRPVYTVGDPMRLTLLTSQASGRVYLDIVRQGQTVSTRSVDISQGQAEVVVDLTPDLYGTLELHAYKITRSGNIIRDTRLVVVDQAAGLSLTLTPGSDVYLPGDTAGLDLQVSGQDGEGVPAAIGLAVVDESVFALAEQDPGFARLYFLLEQELLQPRYDLHGFSVPDLLGGLPVDSQELYSAVESTARASLAAASVGGGGPLFSLQASSHEEALKRAYTIQAKFFRGLSSSLYGLFLLPAPIMLLLSAYALHKQNLLGRSILAALAVVLVLWLVFLAWPVDPNRWWVETPLDRLEVFFSWLVDDALPVLGVLALLGLAGFLGLAVNAWRRNDRPLGVTLALLPVFLVLTGFLLYAASQANLNPSTAVFLWALLSLLMLPLAFLLRFGGYAFGNQTFPSLAALALGLFLLLGGLPLLTLVGDMPGTGNAGMRMMVEAEMLVAEEGALPMPAMAPMATMEAPRDAAEDKAGAAAGETDQAAPPRLRQYFPETMLWLPDAVTGPDGALHLDIPVADSITTWRMTALASSQDGRLGSAVAGLRVFQDFFVDLDLPLALTVGDEVSVPVGVFNYLPEAQTVSLELERAGWFELLDEPVKEIEIAANDITVVYFRVRAVHFGMQPFKVTALGSRMSDAILKEVRVFPNGKQIPFTQSDRLTPGEPVRQVVEIPGEAIPGTQTLLVKIYPGILSQVVEGLDSILRMPNGCFEQTSSTTYPNVLVLDYLNSTGQASPETQLKAEEYINLGYQRLTTFEVASSGGFSLFGDSPADRMLTAYGLQEFTDMSRVHDVDPALLERAARWLLSQQAGDGSWENDRGLVHESTWSSLGNDRLPVTAYITWSLVEAGFGSEAGVSNGLAYVREHQAQAEDVYVLALVANTLVAADLQAGPNLDPSTQAVLDRLASKAVQEGSGAYWKSGVATFMGSEGQTGSIETTALAALAFLRSNAHTDLGNAGLTYLVQQKDSFGTWYNTQATVLALKALLESVRSGGEDVDATVTILLNGGQTRTVQVTPENFDVMQLVSFDDVKPGENIVDIQVEGEGNLMYQVAGSYYLPWDVLPQYPELSGAQDLVSITLTYDRSELVVNDTVGVNVVVTLNEPGGVAESALIDLGLPPGFSLMAEDLAALVAYYNDTPEDYPFPKIERFEVTGRQIMIYVTNLSAGNPLEFGYRLLAKFPLMAQTPPSSAYDYYNPEVSGQLAPQFLTVTP